MDEYMRALKKYLKYENRTGKNGGVCEYVQRQMAYNSCRMDSCRLDESAIALMYETGQVDDAWPADDVLTIQNHFQALRYAIGNAERYGEAERPENLREIAEYHVRWRQHGGDRRTGLILAFIQCLNANICPFIVHADNQTEYESRITDAARLEQFFKTEQRAFYRETEAMVIDQV